MAAMAAFLDFGSELFANFDLEVTPMLPTKFQVKWPFGSGEEAKIRYLRWWLRQPSWIFDQKDFKFFLSKSHPNASYGVSSQLAFWFRRNEK